MAVLVLGVMLGTSASTASAIVIHPTMVHVHASAYAPRAAEPGDYAAVVWGFGGLPPATKRSVTDATGLNLFDSGLRDVDSQPFPFRFFGAGTYVYDSSNRTAMTGTIVDPMAAWWAGRTPNPTFNIRFKGPLSPRVRLAFGEDVQIKRPGAASFHWWRYGVRSGGATFTTKTRGVYLFRARLRRIRTDKTSHFSPPISVTVR